MSPRDLTTLSCHLSAKLAGRRCQVDPALRVPFKGHSWAVSHIPGLNVGDVVFCYQEHPDDALHVLALNGETLGTSASRHALAHSHPHTSPLVGIPASSGNSTTLNAPGHRRSSPAPRTVHTDQPLRAATLSGRTRSHSGGKAAVAPAADPMSISLDVALETAGLPRHGKKGIRKSRAGALHISIKVVA